MQADPVSTPLAASSVSHDGTLPPGFLKSHSSVHPFAGPLLRRHTLLSAASAAVLSLLLVGCEVSPGPSRPSDDADTPPELRATLSDQIYTVGVALTVTLPSATGGNGALSYSLEPTLPWLTFEAETLTLSGTPTMAGTYGMTYRVVDADENLAETDAATLVFDITTLATKEITTTYSGSGDQVLFLNPSGDRVDNAPVILLLGNTSANVYLISTNATVEALTPRIERLDVSKASSAPAAGVEHRSLSASDITLGGDTRHRAQHGFTHDSSSRESNYSLQSRPAVSVGERFTFHNVTSDPTEEYDIVGTVNNEAHYLVAIPSTARKVVTDGTMTFAIWVADRDWGTCSRCVRQEMIDAAADRFLRPGSGNDIHDWVTAIFGAPWGPHDSSHLIPPEYADEVHLLVATTESNYNPMHNHRREGSGFRFSNERLMFTMHPGLLVSADGSTWEVTDSGPSFFIGSALAHEYQHAIHFYQKYVRHHGGLIRHPAQYQWIQEMTSMVVEDLIAEKVMLGDGPRDVVYDDPSAGPTPNQSNDMLALIPLYNSNNDWQASTWNGSRTSYAINYALGAYLARTYGVALFRDMVQNDRSGVHAIEAALRAQGHSTSFGEVLQNWAVANVLSDNTAAPHPYRYNSGTWFTSEAGGEAFRLGSINLFNYRYYGESGYTLNGPRFYSLSEFSRKGTQPRHSNRYLALGDVTGAVRLRVTSEPGNRITVVVKE